MLGVALWNKQHHFAEFMRKQLILITGVGNHDRLFAFFAFVWRLFGYEAHVEAFGWSDDASQFESKMANLLANIDRCRGKPVYVIGSSAGGTAAVHALAARPEAIAKIATLCSPLKTMPDLQNPLLETSIARLPASFSRFNAATREKLLSVHTSYDDVVDTSLSKLPDVRTYQLPTRGHGFTIFMGLTIMSFPIRRFFRSKQ